MTDADLDAFLVELGLAGIEDAALAAALEEVGL